MLQGKGPREGGLRLRHPSRSLDDLENLVRISGFLHSVDHHIGLRDRDHPGTSHRVLLGPHSNHDRRDKSDANRDGE